MNIKTALGLLNQMVEQGVIEDYALAGAVASVFYLEPMATVDVDVFVKLRSDPGSAIQDPSPIFAFLRERGHAMEGEYVMVDGWPVQFLAPPGALGDEALEHANSTDVEGTPLRILSAEHLAAIALQTGRPKDKARLLAFLESASFDMGSYLGILERHGLDSEWDKFKREFDLTDGGQE